LACAHYRRRTPLPIRRELPGPTGEFNVLQYRARGEVLCLQEPALANELLVQLAAALATGNRILLVEGPDARAATAELPWQIRASLRWTRDWPSESFDAVLFCGADDAATRVRRLLAQRSGARIAVLRAVDRAYCLDRLVTEQVVSTNTAAAGGNASLMSLPPA
jgi:RHH-type proline utilization regulon transcriptional repressor/proline dehydrogenase/delta 1-pyrroline-5-carboxylate dehydrogenase